MAGYELPKYLILQEASAARGAPTQELPDREWLRLQEAVDFWHSVYIPNLMASADGEPYSQFEFWRSVCFLSMNGSAEVLFDPEYSAAIVDFNCKLSEAAFARRVKFRGTREDDHTADHELIDFGYFSKPRGFFSATAGALEAFSWYATDDTLFEYATLDQIPVTKWYNVLVNRHDFLGWFDNEYAGLCQSNIAGPDSHKETNLDAVQMSRTGAAGRPSGMHLVRQEFNRRRENGDIPDNASAKSIAKDLADWYEKGPRKKTPDLPPVKAETIRKSLRSDIRLAIPGGEN